MAHSPKGLLGGLGSATYRITGYRPWVLLELRLLELHLLRLGAGVPELLELRHRHGVVVGAEEPLEVGDGVLALGHNAPFGWCVTG